MHGGGRREKGAFYAENGMLSALHDLSARNEMAVGERGGVRGT